MMTSSDSAISSKCTNKTITSYHTLLLSSVGKWVCETPERPAVVCEQQAISWRTLDQQAAQIASLLHHHGVCPGEVIGVYTDRSAQLPATFLGIQKAGAVYLPLTANQPGARLADMIQQAAVRVVIALDDLTPPPDLLTTATSVITPDTPLCDLQPLPPLTPDVEMKEVTAILFTSGSTGRPKGVIITDRAVMHMTAGHMQAQQVGPADRILIANAPGFILGFRELCLPLVSGATSIPASRTILDTPTTLITMMEQKRVSVALLTPSYLRLFNGAVPRGLRCLMTAGERPNPADALHYARHVDYWNMHGATEICGTICMLKVDPETMTGTKALPSGTPFPNTRVGILDDHGNEVPSGQTGEIYVSGPGLSPGYLKQPELTAESFVHTRQGLAYRTGDIGRWNEFGQLEALGRRKDVVKVSGQSVSLGEVERALLHHPAADHAAVIQHDGALVGFVTGASTSTIDWATFLASRLPGYMIPARIHSLPKIPVNTAGKADRQALLGLAATFAEQDRAWVPQRAPQTPLETTIAAVWQRTLLCGPIMRDENFFALGGTSLSAIETAQALQAEGLQTTVQDILGTLTPQALAERLQKRGLSPLPLLPSATPDLQPDTEAVVQPGAADTATPDHGLATAGQADFWVAANLGRPHAGAHVIRVVQLSCQGSFPTASEWLQAWNTLCSTHPALRTCFYADKAGMVHWQTRTVGSPCADTPSFTLRTCASFELAQDQIRTLIHQAFDLAKAPLVRGGVITLADGTSRRLLWLVAHHAIADGGSVSQLQQDYLTLVAGHSLRPARHGIALASHAEQIWRHSQAEEDLAWWQHSLDAIASDSTAFDLLATDCPQGFAQPAPPASPLTTQLDHHTSQGLLTLARTHHCGLHAVMAALLGWEIERRSGRHHVILGCGFSLRPAGADKTVGHFVNLLPLILSAPSGAPFADRLMAAQAALTATLDHAQAPGGEITRAFYNRHNGLRPANASNLFDISLTATPAQDTQNETLSGQPVHLPALDLPPAAGIALAFSYTPSMTADGLLELSIQWDPATVLPETAKRWLDGMVAWAQWLTCTPDATRCAPPALLTQEEEWLAVTENGPQIDRPRSACHQVISARAAQHPETPAVISPQGIQTYGQLEDYANRLAGVLSTLDLGPRRVVGVLTESAPLLPAVVLGIWKAGAIYLPLPREMLATRLAYMAKDAGARVLISVPGSEGSSIPAPLATMPVILDAGSLPEAAKIPAAPTTCEDVAYIIYTSGTTGKPKGVAVPHRGLINAVFSHGENIQIGPQDRIALAAIPGFDASPWEMGMALMHGASAVPVSRTLRDDPWALKRYYADQRVTVAFHAPSYLRVSQDVPFTGLRVLTTGGEAPSHADAAHHGAPLSFWNAYGPTETSVLITVGEVTRETSPLRPLPAGRPLSNSRVSLRRTDGGRVPPGEVGEVWLAGHGVADGYLNAPQLTQERFVTTAEGRFYRSGDLARWTPDGLLELLGRKDQQIKLHGQRIELGEIEATLQDHPAVRQAAVLADRKDGNLTLRAFVISDTPNSLPESWRDWLASRLPVHMIPATFTVTDRIPFTPNGKIDAPVLLARVDDDRGCTRTAPATALETIIATLWEDLLDAGLPERYPRIAREDDFFALGGNSLLAVTMAHRLAKEIDRSVSARDLFIAPTLSQFAALLSPSDQAVVSTPQEDASPPPVTLVVEPDLATLGEAEFQLAETAGLDTGHFTIRVVRLVTGSVPDPSAWQRALGALTTRHPALRSWFEEENNGKVWRHALPARGMTAPLVQSAFESTTAATLPAAMDVMAAAHQTPLTMDEAPLWRAGLVTIEDGTAPLFWFTLHHSIADGHSAAILTNELAALLREETLPPLTFSQRDRSAREQRYLVSSEARSDATYWRTLLTTLPTDIFDETRLDFARTTLTTGSSEAPAGTLRLRKSLSGPDVAALRELAKRNNASLHAVILALTGCETQRRGDREGVMIGTTATTRETAAENTLAGYAVTLLPIPILRADSFGACLRATQATLARGLHHARYPFTLICQDFWAERPSHRDPARFPLFDIVVTENPASSPSPVAGISLQPLSADLLPARETDPWSPGQDMVLAHETLPDGSMLFDLKTHQGLFLPETAQRWLDGLIGWARWLAADLNRAEIPMPSLLPDEETWLHSTEHGPRRDRPQQAAHHLISAWASRQPNAAAVVTETTTQSYAQIEAHANQLAGVLCSVDLGPQRIVGVLTGCDPLLPAVVLGIWKAGAVYLPLPRQLPASRLDYMARDAGVQVLITVPGDDGDIVPAPLDQFPVVLDAAALPDAPFVEPANTTCDDTAYVIYTSGTTGTPKGVEVTHRGILNAVLSHGEAVGLSAADRAPLAAIPGFDASPWELGMALFHGGAVVPVSRALRDDPWALKRHYAALGVTTAFHAPSYLRVSQDTPFQGLRVLTTGGEAPNHTDVARHGPPVELWNAYGPTETTIIITLGKVDPQSDQRRPIPAGRPLPNSCVSLRRADGSKVPPGEIGELWLGGFGVAKGYLNNPDLTRDRFVSTPDGPFYRSGDLGRWTGEGEIELLGRRDQQIKLHGQRIELGEIETVLQSHPAVCQAAVLADRRSGDITLRAFVVMTDKDGAQSVLPERWRDWLAPQLPVHMIPATFTRTDRIPFTVNGKIDAPALFALCEDDDVAGRTPPANEQEQTIAALWQDLLSAGLTRRTPMIAREDDFFALGGNSLLAVAMAHRLATLLNRPVPARDLFIAPTLAQFAARLNGPDSSTASTAQEPQAEDPVTASAATLGETEFHLAESAGLDTRHFTIPVLRRVNGPCPSQEKWQQAWDTLIARHPALRCWFELTGDDTLQRRIAPADHSDRRIRDLEYLTLPDRSTALEHIRHRQTTVLSMGAAPLWRAGLVSIEDSTPQKLKETWFWLALHHSVGDGTSVEILVSELAALLRGNPLAPLSGDLTDLAAMERTYLTSSAMDEDAAYWRHSLATVPETAFEEWQLDHPRSADTPAGCHRLEAVLTSADAQALRHLAREHRASLHALLLALLASEVDRRCGRAAMILGSTAALRDDPRCTTAVGYAVNMIPLPMTIQAGQPFGDRLRATQATLAEALHHARYPFAKIYHDYWQDQPGRRDPNRYPLFDIAVTENPDGPERPVASGALRLERLETETTTTPDGIAYSLGNHSPGQDMVFIHESLPGGGLALKWQMNAALYDRDTAFDWLDGLMTAARWLASDLTRSHIPLPNLFECEQNNLARWQQGETIRRPDLPVHRLFERLAKDPLHAEHPALLDPAGGPSISYRRLNHRATILSRILAIRGIAIGDVVAVLTPRGCADLPATVLAIWKAGAAYLPLDASLPAARLSYMIRDSAATMLLIIGGSTPPTDLPEGCQTVSCDDFLVSDEAPTVPAGHSPSPCNGTTADTAYILYTSGSTGQPKGVQISHRACVNTLMSVAESFAVGADDRCLLFASPSFDVSISDIGVPLISGAALCPVPSELVDRPQAFVALLENQKITIADLPPAYLRLLDGAALPSLRILVTGGEAPVEQDVIHYGVRLGYFNAYGPTENAITSTMGPLPVNGAPDVLSCGRPLPNTSVEIRRPDGSLLPPGAWGEIWLGGVGLAEGYVNAARQTAKAFVETPEGRRYRSGDLGRWRLCDRREAVLEVRGRIDQQVKLNGIRMEPGEIEHALEHHPSIVQAAVVMDTRERQHSLWAFVRTCDGAPLPDSGPSSWRTEISQRLPTPMIPSGLVIVDTFPVSPSGKVDKDSLIRRLATEPREPRQNGEPPRGPIEEAVAAAWTMVLDTITEGQALCRNDDFFRLGGHSLLAIAVAHHLEKALGFAVSARDLFADPTLSGFAHRIQRRTPTEDLRLDDASNDLATDGQREFWVAETAGLDTRGFIISMALTVSGNIPDLHEWQSAWAALCVRHGALRTTFGEDEAGRLRSQDQDPTGLPDLAISEVETLDDALATARKAMDTVIPMGQPPLWRVGLVQTADPSRAVFWLALHHAIGDGLTLGLLVEDLSALLRGQSLPPLAGSVRHSASRERAYLASSEAITDGTYWQETLSHMVQSGQGTTEGLRPFDEWPLDHPRPLDRSEKTTRGSHVLRLRLPPEIARGLRRQGQLHGASLHAVMLAIMAIEVHRRTGRHHFLLGTPASTRDTVHETKVAGYYVNMMPLACHLTSPADAPLTLATVLANVQHSLINGLHHCRYPAARILKEFREAHPAAQQPGRYPLFDMIVTENPGGTAAAGCDNGDFTFSTPVNALSETPVYRLTTNAPAQDIVLAHEAQADGSHMMQVFVNAALYDRDTAEAWLTSLAAMARHIAQTESDSPLPDVLSSEHACLSRLEHGPTRAVPAPRLDLLAAQWPANQPALITSEQTLTYGQLCTEADALAAALVAKGLQKNASVGVLTGRSVALPAAVMGIWKAGGCYVPLTHDLPEKRLAFIARDASITHLIALDGLNPPSVLQALPLLRPEALTIAAVRPSEPTPERALDSGLTSVLSSCGENDPAYVLYTSGSTGTPKGVIIRHGGLTNLGTALAHAFAMQPADRAMMMASPSFDLWLSDLAMCWASGAAVVPLVQDEIESIASLPRLIAQRGITIATMVPSYLRLLDHQELPGLRLLMTVGEEPIPTDIRHYAPRLDYFNGYGPTENTAASCIGRMAADQSPATVGRPLANTAVHILDTRGRRLPPGAIGEIWVSGVGLAAGYLNRPDLTQRTFVQTPHGRIYRTGDLGRWTASGDLLVLGRTDQQVKLRGQRVELGEVEHALETLPGIRQAVALVDTDGDGMQGLYAFVLTDSPLNDSWRTLLGRHLPSYMVPTAILELPSIPLSLSGKVDKAALSSMLATRKSIASTVTDISETQLGAIESVVAQAWQSVLHCRPVTPDDDFFRLGGHSLLAMAVAHKLERTLGWPVPARLLFADPSLRGFARAVAALGDVHGSTATPSLPLSANEDLSENDTADGTSPLSADLASEGQQEFWIAEEAGLDTRGFTIPLLLTFSGTIPDDVAWQQAWRTLVSRHLALHCVFARDQAGALHLREVPPDRLPALSCTKDSTLEQAIDQGRAEITCALSMSRPPLWRAGLIRIPSSSHGVFWLAVHHAVADGLTLGILVEELITLLRDGSLPPQEGSMRHAVLEEQAYLAGPEAASDAAYWAETLDHMVHCGDQMADGQRPFDEFILDHPRPLGRTEKAARGSHVFRQRLAPEVALGLRKLAQQHGASLHTVVLTLMAIEVSRRTGREHFLLGTAASTRNSAKDARVAGYYINMLPLACHLDLAHEQTLSVVLALSRIHQSLISGLHHCRYPVGQILKDFRKAHPEVLQPGRYPLFDMSVTENPGSLDRPDPSAPFVVTSPQVNAGATARYRWSEASPTQDMVLSHDSQPDGTMTLQWSVNAALFERDTAEAWLTSLTALARSAALDDSTAPLPELLPEERALLDQWEYGPVRPLSAPRLDLLTSQWPKNQIAQVTAHETLTYGELNRQADGIAAALHAQGIERNDAVGVLTGRSAALSAAVLGIWKAGGCYVPLTSDLPEDRLAFIAGDAGIGHLVVLDGLSIPASLTGLPLLRPKTAPGEGLDSAAHSYPPSPCGEDDPAYVLYTSGSTGTPKGVVIRHGGLVNFSLALVETFAITPADRVLMMASPSFDLSISDLAMTWAGGAAGIPLLRDEMEDVNGLPALMAQRGITIATMAPSYLRLLDRQDLPGIRLLMTVGEQPIMADAQHYAARLDYRNGYGPTENTVATGIGQIGPSDTMVTVGRPLANTSVHILDSQQRPVPPGALGEIWIGGKGLAAGYLNRPDLTQRAFVETPHGRRYRTGDLGRWTNTGNLVVVGRTDDQVKLRGQRIELGEIEKALESLPGVRQAVALISTDADGTQGLYAFVLTDQTTTNKSAADDTLNTGVFADDWRQPLGQRLPSYMVPTTVLEVPEIPVTLAGKVDKANLRRALSSHFVRQETTPVISPPRGPVEQRIAEIWSEVLQRPAIGRHDHFFELGGDSLRATSMVSKVRREFACKVNDLYENPRLADFAAICKPQPGHLSAMLDACRTHWQGWQQRQQAYEAERTITLDAARRTYQARNATMNTFDTTSRDYQHVLLTGATGYLGAYLVRSLLQNPDRQVTALVRGPDNQHAAARLQTVLAHYFGPEAQTLASDGRLTVVAGDLRHATLGVSPQTYGHITEQAQAIFHCAANVNHYGHYQDSHADNVLATHHLIDLATQVGQRCGQTADLHFISTLSVCGNSPASGFRLFTEYDGPPNELDENYYVRSKQEAETLVEAARGTLSNACIHRVGNVSFATDSPILQRDIHLNAFFRLVSALTRLGLVPGDMHAWLCHVDVVAAAIIALSSAKGLSNLTHHIEHARRDTLADVVLAAPGMDHHVRRGTYADLLDCLEQASSDANREPLVSELLGPFGIYRGRSPQEEDRRTEIASQRTQMLLAQLGVHWPDAIPGSGLASLMQAALRGL